MGPAGPPPSVRQLQSHVESNTRDDDDVFGPMPAPSSREVDPEVELERKRLEIEARVANAVNNGSEGDADGESSDKPKTRGAWMLVPPEAKKLNAVLGTELKSRQFSRTAKQDHVDQSGWTRLPGETKETNISLVRKEIAKPSATPLAESFDYDAVNEYNKVHRPKSLMEMHTAEYVSSTKFAENDASSRKFDRERDLGSRRTSAKARDNLVRGADHLNRPRSTETDPLLPGSQSQGGSGSPSVSGGYILNGAHDELSKEARALANAVHEKELLRKIVQRTAE
ncbi:hypothetical protein HDU84_009380 [Entophlyctis sp. JEL0112]|nr:hypothetical protein HDU84_009380 [Entophlyctis sp. JEL0112]